MTPRRRYGPSRRGADPTAPLRRPRPRQSRRRALSRVSSNRRVVGHGLVRYGVVRSRPCLGSSVAASSIRRHRSRRRRLGACGQRVDGAASPDSSAPSPVAPSHTATAADRCSSSPSTIRSTPVALRKSPDTRKVDPPSRHRRRLGCTLRGIPRTASRPTRSFGLLAHPTIGVGHGGCGRHPVTNRARSPIALPFRRIGETWSGTLRHHRTRGGHHHRHHRRSAVRDRTAAAPVRSARSARSTSTFFELAGLAAVAAPRRHRRRPSGPACGADPAARRGHPTNVPFVPPTALGRRRRRAPHHQLGRQQVVPHRRRVARAARRAPPPPAPPRPRVPFATTSWRTVVSAGLRRRASGESSKPTTDSSAGTRRPSVRGGAQHVRGEGVGEAEHRRRPVRAGEQLPGRAVTPLVSGRPCRRTARTGVDPGRVQRVAPAPHPLARDVPVAGSPDASGPAVSTRDPPVPQLDEVRGRGARAGPVVDVDAR